MTDYDAVLTQREDTPAEVPVYERSAPEEVQRRIDYLLDQLTRRLDLRTLTSLAPARRDEELSQAIAHLMDTECPLDNPFEREQTLQLLRDEILGLGPLETLLRDDSISEIMVNGAAMLFVERNGRLEELPPLFRTDDHVLRIIERIVSRVGRRIDETAPMVDARLPDGSRVNAIIPPLALRGPTLTIRRFGKRPLTLENLLQHRALPGEMAALMQASVQGRLNVVVSGGTGSGKTTLLNVLSGFIPAQERIVTIEDAAELQLQQRHVIPLETRPPRVEGQGAVSMRDLVRNALRMRPDRIIVGECRGPEALDMLQAMNSGHEGSLTTLHANSARDALTRLETMIMMAGYDMPLRAIRRQITSAIHLIIQAERLAGGARKVTSMTEVVGMEGDTIVTQDVFVFQQQGTDAAGRAVGRFVATGVRPSFAQRLKAMGLELAPQMFVQRVLAT